MTLLAYMNQLSAAAKFHLISPEGGYQGIEGHKKFARECGAAIPDFTEKEQKDFIGSTYGGLYVKACGLRPLLDMKDWAKECRKGWEKALQVKEEMREIRKQLESKQNT